MLGGRIVEAKNSLCRDYCADRKKQVVHMRLYIKPPWLLAVSNWEGGQCSMDEDKQRDNHMARKRASDDEYDEEYDRGKVAIMF